MGDTDGNEEGPGLDLDNDEYVSWFSYLFPWSGNAPLLFVSASVSIGIVLVGYIIAVIGNADFPNFYLFDPTVHLGAGGIFWALAWLGWIDRVYIDLWNEVRPVFAVDAETYHSVVRPRLDRIYDQRRLLGYWAVVVIPSFIIIAVLSLPWIPPQLQNPAQDFIWELSPTGGVIRSFYVAVESLLIVTSFNIFLNHIFLLNELSELPFRDLFTSASELEPVVGYSMAGATAWFVGVSGVGLWIQLVSMNRKFELAIIALLILVGLVAFFAPTLLLHFALEDAKRRALVDLRKQYEEIHRLTEQEDGSSEDLSLRLEITDRRLESVKSIETWSYDIISVSELLAASVIPWLTLAERSLNIFLEYISSQLG